MSGQFDTQNYDGLLEEKRQRLETFFSPYYSSEIEVFASEKKHYRMRAEFRVWHDGEDLYLYMFDNISKERVRIDEFLPASLLINKVMKELLWEIRKNAQLRQNLFQMDFLSTLTGEILVTLLYHRALSDDWTYEAKKLKEKLSTHFKINLIGRSRKKKIAVDCNYVIEEFNILGTKYIYKQIENSFTQPNAKVAIKMLEWAKTITKSFSGDLLELFCGNGNFSIALSSNFRKILATELSSSSVEAALFNRDANNISNMNVVRMSSEDFTDAIFGKREFNRLRGLNLAEFDIKTILVDPPRSGLDPGTIALAKNYENILYISCNPETLLANLEELIKSHDLFKVALFDQFPYTNHIECGVLLKKRV